LFLFLLLLLLLLLLLNHLAKVLGQRVAYCGEFNVLGR
jgi:hypothetical protein